MSFETHNYLQISKSLDGTKIDQIHNNAILHTNNEAFSRSQDKCIPTQKIKHKT
jgi:hypothetical protein